MKFYEYFLLNKMCCVASGRFGKLFLGWSKKLNRVDLLVLEKRNSCYRWQHEISIYRPTSVPPICKSKTWCLLIAMVNLNNYLHSNVKLNVFYALLMHISQLLFYHKFSAIGGALYGELLELLLFGAQFRWMLGADILIKGCEIHPLCSCETSQLVTLCSTHLPVLTQSLCI